MPARISHDRRLARALLVALCACAAALPALASAQGADPHAHHRAATSAPVQTPAREMEEQPVLRGVFLVDTAGNAVALDEVVAAEGPVFLNFIFTTCTTICPVMSAGFGRLEDQLAARGQKVRLVSISIDPEVDTPARLREYAARAGAGGDWHFLTGRPSAVEAAQRAFGAYRGSKEAHAAATYVRRSPSEPWGRIDGLASADTLIRASTGDNATGGR